MLTKGNYIMKKPECLEEVNNDRVPERYGIIFNTEKNHYFYDRGTGKVIQCEEWEQKFLEDILCGVTSQKAEDDIWRKGISSTRLEIFYTELEKENLLMAPQYTRMSSITKEELKESTYGLSQLILELTEKCNLRCRYCIYNENYEQFRNFDYDDMSWDIAKKGLDYAYEHSGTKISITFYGGEPLVNFNILKQSIEYSLKNFTDKKISFSFTTNLTLMTSEKAKFFASLEDVYILCSLDGPESIHDKYRIRVDGGGSFNKAIEGLKNLVDAFGERSKECIAINTVVCPPYCEEKYQKITNYFESLDWLPKESQINYVYVSSGTLELSKEEIDNVKSIEDKFGYKLIQDWQFDYRSKDEKKEMVEQFIKTNFKGIHERLITDKPIDFLPCNGCCIPGKRRLYITIKGDFQICEKMGNSVRLGSLENGIDFENVLEKYFKEYEEISLPECSECWASALCSLCYVMSYDKNGINIRKKRSNCEGQRAATLDNLKKYHQLLEEQPDRLKKIFEKQSNHI